MTEFSLMAVKLITHEPDVDIISNPPSEIRSILLVKDRYYSPAPLMLNTVLSLTLFLTLSRRFTVPGRVYVLAWMLCATSSLPGGLVAVEEKYHALIFPT